MKKIIAFVLVMLAASSLLHAQQDSLSRMVEQKSAALKQLGNNELKINLLVSVLGMPEVTYERLLEDNMGVGISIGVNLDNATDGPFGGIKFMAIPYYRLYFGNKKASGFFIEGNAAVVNVTDRYGYFEDSINGTSNYTRTKENTTNFGLGAAIGGKFLARNGFLGEVFGGVGRLFGDTRVTEAYPRIGISIGKRF